MKNKILVALAALTCGIFCVSPLCVGAALPGFGDIVAETIFSDLIGRSAEKDEDGNRKGLVGALRDYQNFFPEGSFLNPIIANDEISFKIPNYRICTGKVHFVGDFVFYDGEDQPSSTVACNQTIEMTYLCMDTDYNSFDYDKTVAITKENGTGKYLFGNALNVRVIDDLGNETNFIMSCRSSLYSKTGVGINTVSIAQAYYDVYMYTGNQLTQLLYSDRYNHGVRFTQRTTNSIDVDVASITLPPTGNTAYIPNSRPSGFQPYGQSTAQPSNRMTISSISDGRVYMAYKRKSGSSGGTWLNVNGYPFDYMFMGFYITNNNTDERTINSNWTELHQQNYYIDNIFEGNTIINKNNYQDWGGGALAPVFELPDVDLPSLPLSDILDILTDLLPDVQARLQPSIDVGLDSLFDRLLDFYGNMPDIGLEWSPDLDNNNYFDVELPPVPDSGGGSGDITVNVDITRPKIPYIDTDPQITLYVPTVTTTALPQSVISAGKEFVDWGKEITDTVGTTGIIITCGLIGVGVMLVFKDW